jgi:four helix bundle protein
MLPEPHALGENSMAITPQQHEALESAVALFKDIYQATETWPRMQTFGLIMDIRRAAMGVSTNLTECQNLSWGQGASEFIVISQDLLSDLTSLLLSAKQNPALAASEVEPLLQQAKALQSKLQGLPASLT